MKVHPSLLMDNVKPASIEQQNWDSRFKEFFIYNGEYYYIDKRHSSPYDGFEYDIWTYSGPHKLQGRVTNTELIFKMITHINRRKKINKILGKKD